MLKLLEKKSILYLWIIVYTMMLMIPIFSNFYSFNAIHQQLEKEITITNQYFLNNISKTFDSIFSEVNTIKIDMQRNKTVYDILKLEDISSETRYLAAAVVEDLQYEKLKSKAVTDIFVYLPKLDLVITSDAVYESETYFRYRIAEGVDQYEAWKEQLRAITEKTILDGSIVNDNGETKKVARFIEPIEDNHGNNQFILNVYIDHSVMFRDVEESAAINEKSLFIVNSHNEVMYRYGSWVDHIGFTKPILNKEYEMNGFSIDHKESTIAFVNSKVYRYKYVYVTPANILRERMNRAIVTNIVINTACLIVMTIIIAFFAKWNYGKISLILNSLAEVNIHRKKTKKNEYQLIMETIHSAADHRHQLESKLESQNIALKNSFLSDYLKGFSNPVQYMQDRRDDYGLNFRYDSFVVVAVYIREFGVMCNAINDTIFILKNIINDLPTDHEIVWVEMDCMLYGIINIHDGSDGHYKCTVKALFEHACDLAFEALEINFNVAVSSKKEQFESLPGLYREAVSALEYSSFYEVYETVFYDDLSERNSPSLMQYSYAKENALIVNIKTGNQEGAKKALLDLFDESMTSGSIDKLTIKSLAYNITNTILKTVKEIDDANVGTMFQNTVYLETLEACKTVGEYRAYLFGLLEKIFEGYQSTNDRASTIYNHVKEYVDMHFKESSLYVSSIGDHFKMSSLYLSRIFKEKSGSKLSYYINSLRVNYAKTIIKDSVNLKIEKVAKMVGYENTRTFVNAFKEREGITPTQYKNSQ